MAIQKPKDFIRERIVYGHKITLPICPPKDKIANYNLPQKEQRFIRQPLPPDLNKWTPEQRKEYIAREWDRRINGYWFYNNGNIEYCTGLHYFYVSWWKIGNQYPIWTDMNRDFFYVWNLVENDIYCDGLVFISYRGSGKTILSTAVVYEPISRKYGVNASFQSKTDGDAKKIFKRLVSSWQRLPTFFKPLDTGENRPTTTLDFSEPSKRDTKQLNKEAQDFLGSLISFAASSASALDGDNLHRAVIDEFAKAFNVDTVERLKVVRETLRAGRSQYGRGKILNTSTVEESEKKGTVNSRKIWDDANHLVRDANGFTKNGMYRIFVPATDGYLEIIGGETFIDEYGYSLKEKARDFFTKKRENLRGTDLNSERRKYPLEEKDIWVSDTKLAVYNLERLNDQITFNETLPRSIFDRGNFYWLGERFGAVGWDSDKNGRWLTIWKPTIQEANKTLIQFGKKAPASTDITCAGLDPFDHNVVIDKGSNAASYVIRKFNPMNPYETGIPVSEYINRPTTSDMMYEDMAMQSIYYGHKILIEDQKIGCINFFHRNGLENYLMVRPVETLSQIQKQSKAMITKVGIAMTPAVQQVVLDKNATFVNTKVGYIQEEGQEPYMGRVYFNNLLNCLSNYDSDDDFTEYDEMVGFGLALIAASEYKHIIKERKQYDFFPKYEMSKGHRYR